MRRGRESRSFRSRSISAGRVAVAARPFADGARQDALGIAGRAAGRLQSAQPGVRGRRRRAAADAGATARSRSFQRLEAAAPMQRARVRARRGARPATAPMTMAWVWRSTISSTRQSMPASASASSGAPVTSVTQSPRAKRSAPLTPPRPAKRSASARAAAPSTLTAKAPHSRRRASVAAARLMQTTSEGGRQRKRGQRRHRAAGARFALAASHDGDAGGEFAHGESESRALGVGRRARSFRWLRHCVCGLSRQSIGFVLLATPPRHRKRGRVSRPPCVARSSASQLRKSRTPAARQGACVERESLGRERRRQIGARRRRGPRGEIR